MKRITVLTIAVALGAVLGAAVQAAPAHESVHPTALYVHRNGLQATVLVFSSTATCDSAAAELRRRSDGEYRALCIPVSGLITH